MSELALIGLGSNLGDRQAHLDFAVAALSNTPGVRLQALSSYRETPPVGGPSGQGAFLNAAAAIETTLNPIQVLLLLQSIEADAGRLRKARWGERTLDLDLLLFGDLLLDLPNLKVPHPLFALRRFVLAPLVEIGADVLDPLTKRSVKQLLANLDRRPSYVAISGRLPGEAVSLEFLARCLAIARRWDRKVNFPEFLTRVLKERGKSPGYQLAERLVSELEGNFVLDRLVELVASHIPSEERDSSFGLTPAEGTALSSQAHDSSYWSSTVPRERWIVSDDWFDDLAPMASETVLGLTPFPRDRARERFLRVREQVLRPTFVVMTPETHERLLQLDDFVGRDTPALIVDELGSAAALAAVLAACAATRAG